MYCNEYYNVFSLAGIWSFHTFLTKHQAPDPQHDPKQDAWMGNAECLPLMFTTEPPL